MKSWQVWSPQVKGPGVSLSLEPLADLPDFVQSPQMWVVKHKLAITKYSQFLQILSMNCTVS